MPGNDGNTIEGFLNRADTFLQKSRLIASRPNWLRIRHNLKGKECMIHLLISQNGQRMKHLQLRIQKGLDLRGQYFRLTNQVFHF